MIAAETFSTILPTDKTGAAYTTLLALVNRYEVQRAAAALAEDD